MSFFSGGFILAFHDIDTDRFAGLVEALSPSQPVHLADLLERQQQGRNTRGLFAITVDDGVGDTVRSLSEVAIRHRWPVTFFLPSGYIDNPGGLAFQWVRRLVARAPAARFRLHGAMADLSTTDSRRRFEDETLGWMHTRHADEYAALIDDLVNHGIQGGWFVPDRDGPPPPVRWEDVRTLAANEEIRFESHGVSHTATAALSGEQLDRELRESRERIEEHSGRPCRYFAYPFGSPQSIGPTSPAMVARYYDGAVTMSRGRLGKGNPFLLPRIPLYEEDTPARAWLKVLTAR